VVLIRAGPEAVGSTKDTTAMKITGRGLRFGFEGDLGAKAFDAALEVGDGAGLAGMSR
jgi:hypothetical protein